MRIAPFATRPLERALRAGPSLVAAARASGVTCFAVSLVEGPAVLLGRHQLAARVLDLAEARRAQVPVARRRTAGTAAFVGDRALVCSLALPHVRALFPDASFRTLLNRHVRPLLRGLTAAGALAHYFGREWVSSRRRPVMLLGFDVEPDGAVLVEAIAGIDRPFAVPPSLASADERAVDRYGGASPAALSELLPAGRAPADVARCLAEAMAARASTRVEEDAALLEGAGSESILYTADDSIAAVDLSPAHPVPPGAELLPPARIPVGWLERARSPAGGLWLGGDLLAPRAWLDRLGATVFNEASGAARRPPIAPATQASDRVIETDPYTGDPPLDGVSLADLLDHLSSAAP